MPINYVQLGDRIRIARCEKHFSQETLAEAVDISRTHISCLERGERTPSVETLANMALVLNVTTDWLLGITNDPPATVLTDCTPEEGSILTQNMQELKDTLKKYRIIRK